MVFPRPRSGGVLRRGSRWRWRTTGHLPSAGGSGPPRSRRGRPRWPSRGGLREPEAFGEGLQSGTVADRPPKVSRPPPPVPRFRERRLEARSSRWSGAAAPARTPEGAGTTPSDTRPTPVRHPWGTTVWRPRPPPPVQGSASEVFSAEKFSQPENRSFPALKIFKCCAQRTVLMLPRPDPVSPTGPKLWRPRFPPVPSKVVPRPRFPASKVSPRPSVTGR